MVLRRSLRGSVRGSPQRRSRAVSAACVVTRCTLGGVGRHSETRGSEAVSSSPSPSTTTPRFTVDGAAIHTVGCVERAEDSGALFIF